MKYRERRTVHHADRVYNVIKDESASGRSALAASWKRSLRHYGLDPNNNAPPRFLDTDAYRDVIERNALMTEAAQPVMDRLYSAIRRNGCCLLLSDAKGIGLERRCSDSDETLFSNWGLAPRAIWDEAHEGTNGIGTCLADDRIITIHKDQHFFSRNSALSCTMAPIHDASGAIAGGIDVSSCRADCDERTTALLSVIVEDAARRIENRLFNATYAGNKIVSLGCEMQAMLALDKNDVVIGTNRAARALFDIRADTTTTLPDLLSDTGQESPGHAAQAALQRVLKRCGGNISAAARELGVSRATLHRKLKKALTS